MQHAPPHAHNGWERPTFLRSAIFSCSAAVEVKFSTLPNDFS